MSTPPALAAPAADAGFGAALAARLGLPGAADDGAVCEALADLLTRTAADVPAGYVSAETYSITCSALRQTRALAALIRALDADAASRPAGTVTRAAYAAQGLDLAAATAAVVALRVLTDRAAAGTDAGFRADLRRRLGLSSSACPRTVAVALADLAIRAHFGCGAWPGFVMRAVAEVAYRDLSAALAAIGAEPDRASAPTGPVPPPAGDAGGDRGLYIALNHREPHGEDCTAAFGLALNVEAGKGAPEWIELLPAGPVIEGRDGRRWIAADPIEIVAATKLAIRLPLVLDFDHASERAELAANAGAAGWIEALEVRAGAIWGRVVWTRRGANAVAEREYRFVSPVFNHTRDAEPRVVALVSAGLVHRPNLALKALNRREAGGGLAALRRTLGLPETASEADAMEAVGALLTRANAAGAPDLARVVPRDQHDTTVAALNAARRELAEFGAAGIQARAAALVDGAVAAGKVVPAARATYLALALNGFDATEAAIGALPALFAPGDGGHWEAREAAPARARDSPNGLTEQQRRICGQLGMDEAQYARTIAEDGGPGPAP